MLLLPPKTDACPICATHHEDAMPHNNESLYYQYRFYGIRGRWPTWADAIAHCTPEMKSVWKQELQEREVWSEPDDGEPIADPPGESINQTIGDISSLSFGPDESINS